MHQVLSECFLCRKLGAAHGEELMANLPTERLTPEEPPFTSVGVDYFGQTIYFSSEQTLTCLLESLQRKTPTVIIVGDRCNTCQTYFGNACSRNIYHLFNWGRNGVILAVVLQLMIWSWLWMKVFIESNGLWPELFKFIAVGMDTSDLRKFIQTLQHLLDRFQNCASLSMMNSKSVTNWNYYSREFVSENYENNQI